jgi:hypothetical protein
MDLQLLPLAEINEKQELLHDYPPAEEALATLKKHNGRFDTTFEQLWTQTNGIKTYQSAKSLWDVTLKVLREELCGHEGFRSLLNEYIKNSGNATILTTLIITVAQITTLPINPAIATIVILYILKIGIGIFCEYIDPTTDANPIVAGTS